MDPTNDHRDINHAERATGDQHTESLHGQVFGKSNDDNVSEHNQSEECSDFDEGESVIDVNSDVTNPIVNTLATSLTPEDHGNISDNDDGALSDLSDEPDYDPFQDDAHLLDLAEANDEEDDQEKEEDTDEVIGRVKVDAHEGVKLLSLDEVPFDRDIRYVNVAVAPRPRQLVEFGDGKRGARAMLRQVSKITKGNAAELAVLDNHYKELDRLKKDYDRKAKERSAALTTDQDRDSRRNRKGRDKDKDKDRDRGKGKDKVKVKGQDKERREKKAGASVPASTETLANAVKPSSRRSLGAAGGSNDQEDDWKLRGKLEMRARDPTAALGDDDSSSDVHVIGGSTRLHEVQRTRSREGFRSDEPRQRWAGYDRYSDAGNGPAHKPRQHPTHQTHQLPQYAEGDRYNYDYNYEYDNNGYDYEYDPSYQQQYQQKYSQRPHQPEHSFQNQHQPRHHYQQHQGYQQQGKYDASRTASYSSTSTSYSYSYATPSGLASAKASASSSSLAAPAAPAAPTAASQAGLRVDAPEFRPPGAY